MQIAIIGGTGAIGGGLALRWGKDTDNEIIIGSRNPESAHEKADEYSQTLRKQDVKSRFVGMQNDKAASQGDVVVLAVPPYHVKDTMNTIRENLHDDSILVTPAVGMNRDDDGFHYNPPSQGSVTRMVADLGPDTIPVVGAFHNLPADRLASLDDRLNIDTLVVSDDEKAKAKVIELSDSIEGLRALDAGPLANASEVESITPLLINIAQANSGLHNLAVRFQ